jgi:uncharacterized protein YjeT (DUF2065 family)
MGYAALALGLVLVVEGLALALAPSRMEHLLARFARMPLDRRRLPALSAVAVGFFLSGLRADLGPDRMSRHGHIELSHCDRDCIAAQQS